MFSFISKKIVGIALSLLVVAAQVYTVYPAYGDEVYTFVVKKQEEKAKNRWSLSDWLETRDRMRLMDLWLALHSPSPYEFYLGGAYQLGNQASGSSYNGTEFTAAAYASIFGLGFQHESHAQGTNMLGLFYLRVFGFHAQAMNITLQAGVRSSSDGYRNALAGVSSSIYIARYFGIEGLYRHYFGSVGNVGLSGARYEGGAFIDFKFLRIYGNYFLDSEVADVGGAQVERSGVALGTKLFF